MTCYLNVNRKDWGREHAIIPAPTRSRNLQQTIQELANKHEVSQQFRRNCLWFWSDDCP